MTKHPPQSPESRARWQAYETAWYCPLCKHWSSAKKIRHHLRDNHPELSELERAKYRSEFGADYFEKRDIAMALLPEYD